MAEPLRRGSGRAASHDRARRCAAYGHRHPASGVRVSRGCGALDPARRRDQARFDVVTSGHRPAACGHDRCTGACRVRGHGGTVSRRSQSEKPADCTRAAAQGSRRRRCSALASDLQRRGGFRAPHRVRQRRESPADARRLAPSRDGDAARARREPRAAGPSTAHRGRTSVDCRRPGRRARRVPGGTGDSGA